VSRVRRPPARAAVRAAYDEAAADYDQRHGDARSERRGRIIDAPQHRAAQGARQVLELGCGTGRLLARIDAPVRIGVDLSPAMLAQARRRGLAVVHADAQALPFAAGSFDAILAPRGLFRYLDYERAFCECARVLAPGGRLAVHQYAARTWSLRDVVRLYERGPAPDPAGDGGLHVRGLDELVAPARGAGLRVAHTHLWRAVRVPPYALPVPTWLPGRWWSHCTVVFVKPSGPDAGPDATVAGDGA
jgi:SAM-dependent methyltransferase